MTTGGSRHYVVIFFCLTGLLTTGCGGVNRRFVIESNVPNAQVFINNKPVGAAPAHSAFEYYGYYNITVVHPDYQTKNERVHVVAPWYAYPPLDFLVEFLPYTLSDVRRYYFNLDAARVTDTTELINSADELRERGWNLPPAPRPAVRKTAPTPNPGVVPQSELPEPEPLPGPSPVVPSVTPNK